MKRLFIFRHRPSDTELSLFPNEHGGGVALSNLEIIAQSKRYAGLYVAVIDAIADRHVRAAGIEKAAAQALARVGTVPLLHFILDRALRLDRMLNAEPACAVVATEDHERADSIDRFCELAGKSAQFNQAAIAEIAKCWQAPLTTAAESPAQQKQGLSVNAPGFVNHLFFFANAGKWRSLRHRARLRWSTLTGRIPATNMLNTQPVLLDQKIYGYRKLAHLAHRIDYTAMPANQGLREEVLVAALHSCTPAIVEFLRAAGLQDNARQQALCRLVGIFFYTHYPSTLLEAAAENLRKSTAQLLPYRGLPVISANLGFHTQAAYLVAGARMLNMPVIGMQHGGHYGYSEEHTGAYEGEYACCDGFITWGWSRLPEHPALTRQKAIALPCPWLSVRRQQWGKLLSAQDRLPHGKPFDVLLMPNKVYPFPPAPSGSHATVNHLPAFAQELRSLVHALSSAGLKVLHKPYNPITTQLLSDTFQSLEEISNGLYRNASTLDKGLTPELLRQCGMVVWDQPGTGFLECLTAGIPNMVLWSRLFNAEPDWACAIFVQLEEVGVVHRDPATLAAEVLRFKSDPAAWMTDRRRIQVVEKFCREYARVSDDWTEDWHKFITTLGPQK